MGPNDTADFLERHKCEVRYREYLPDNLPTDKPWWVCAPGKNPFTGETLRAAVENFAGAHGLTTDTKGE